MLSFQRYMYSMKTMHSNFIVKICLSVCVGRSVGRRSVCLSVRVSDSACRFYLWGPLLKNNS